MRRECDLHRQTDAYGGGRREGVDCVAALGQCAQSALAARVRVAEAECAVRRECEFHRHSDAYGRALRECELHRHSDACGGARRECELHRHSGACGGGRRQCELHRHSDAWGGASREGCVCSAVDGERAECSAIATFVVRQESSVWTVVRGGQRVVPTGECEAYREGELQITVREYRAERDATERCVQQPVNHHLGFPAIFELCSRQLKVYGVEFLTIFLVSDELPNCVAANFFVCYS